MIKPEILELLEVAGYRVEVNIEGDKINYNHLQSSLTDTNEMGDLLGRLKTEKSNALNYLIWERDRYRNIVAVSIETAGVISLRSDIKLVSWASPNGSFVSERVEGEIVNILKDSRVLKVFYNAMSDVPALMIKGIVVNNYTDSMIMSQILGEKGQSHTLAAIVERELGIQPEKQLKKASNLKGKVTIEQLKDKQRDADLTYKIATALIIKLGNVGLISQLRRNERALPFTVRAKIDGIGFDKEAWKRQYESYVSNRDKSRGELLVELGADINLNAPKQLREALRNKGIDIEDTKDETLAKAAKDNHIIRSIREYRKIQKLVTSTGEKLMTYVDWDGRVRASWSMYGAITGRMSCSEPNIQQIGKEIKPYFRAKEGHAFIDCDYSQVELRVVAEISKDKEMIAAFKNGEDLHQKTARMIFGVETISKEQRQIAKTCNFGLIYGMAAKGLQLRLKQTCNIDITIIEAEKFRSKFFRLYKGVRTWQIKTYNKAYVKTIGGKTWRGNQLSPLEKYNYPVQGSAAEGLKEAMALIINEIPDNWKICSVIHDEVLLEVPESEALIAKARLQKWMEEGMERLLKDVPVVAEAAIFDTWQKA